jgi:hypothetical protein
VLVPDNFAQPLLHCKTTSAFILGTLLRPGCHLAGSMSCLGRIKLSLAASNKLTLLAVLQLGLSSTRSDSRSQRRIVCFQGCAPGS